MRSIKRSPVSMFFGSRFWRKLTALQGSSGEGGGGRRGAPEGGRGPVVWDGPAGKVLAGGSGHSGGHGSSGGGHGGGARFGWLRWSGRAAGVDGIPAGGYAGRCRRPGECSGYTWNSPA